MEKIPWHMVPVGLDTLCAFGDIGDQQVVRHPYERENFQAEYGIRFSEWLDTSDDADRAVREAWENLTAERQRQVLREVMNRLQDKVNTIASLL